MAVPPNTDPHRGEHLQSSPKGVWPHPLAMFLGGVFVTIAIAYAAIKCMEWIEKWFQ